MDPQAYKEMAHALSLVAHQAGQVIMTYYGANPQIQLKGDASPVTAADQKGEEIILEGLKAIAPDIPVIAEEAVSAGHIPQIGNRFFLVDPLDGTKEFINNRTEFTVNIALIENGQPSFGVVYAPAMAQLFVTAQIDKALEIHLDPAAGILSKIDFSQARELHCRRPAPEGYVVVASRSHMDRETEDFLKSYAVLAQKSAGSSVKFCLLAQAEADLYPRFGRTMEWDIAAGHAVLQAAGGAVTKSDGTPFPYGKTDEGYANPPFIAWGQLPEH